MYIYIYLTVTMNQLRFLDSNSVFQNNMEAHTKPYVEDRSPIRFT